MMNVLIIGQGGREHALALSLLKSSQVDKVYVGPGNDGMFFQSELIKADMGTTFDEIHDFIELNDVGFVVVGPEDYLAKGIVDFLLAKDIIVYGPSKKAALLESSKIFSKHFMAENNIATADFYIAENYKHGLQLLEEKFSQGDKIVVKADGLAAGKGVVVANNREEAKNALYDFMENKEVKIKSEQLLIERCLTGFEVSVFAVCDGENYRVLGHACDYKRLLDNNEGPNTGGMGCYSVKETLNETLLSKIKNEIIRPTLEGMQKRGSPFKGTLFCGLMVDGEDINVIEYNVRFGDPETQTILPLLKEDLFENLYNASCGKLNSTEDMITEKSSIHVVKSSEGYPSIDSSPMLLGQTVRFEQGDFANAELFFAGVKNEKGNLVNSGGRV